jgi:hypothetical protein
MTDRLLADGPAGYWSEDRPPTPAQHRAIVAAACLVLGIPEPTNRLEATTTLARLRIAEGEVNADEVPEPW